MATRLSPDPRSRASPLGSRSWSFATRATPAASIESAALRAPRREALLRDAPPQALLAVAEWARALVGNDQWRRVSRRIGEAELRRWGREAGASRPGQRLPRASSPPHSAHLVAKLCLPSLGGRRRWWAMTNGDASLAGSAKQSFAAGVAKLELRDQDNARRKHRARRTPRTSSRSSASRRAAASSACRRWAGAGAGGQ